MKVLFTSDLHFFHSRIVEFTERSKVTTQEYHTDFLVDIWNKQVTKGDLVYHLGDFSFGNTEDTFDVLSQLNGQKILIKGNHDRNDWFDKAKGKHGVVNTHQYKEIKIKEASCCLFHFPIASWHKQHHGSFHLHGHSHGQYKAGGKILDVGLDSAYNIFGEHKFFTEEDIYEQMKTKNIAIADSHRADKTS